MTLKTKILISFLLIAFTQYKNELPTNDFKLGFICSGLGSNLGAQQPKFIVDGLRYYYTLERNSKFAATDPDLVDTVCKGKLKANAVEAIIRICQKTNDTLVYETNAGIRSGCIDLLTINYGQAKKEFRLHNASHPDAAAIVAILNNNLPKGKEKIALFGAQ